MRTKAFLATVSGGALLGCISVGPAQAADTAAPAPGTPQSTNIEEVVVTAQKRTTVASKTPIALTVLSGAQLRSQGIVSVTNLQDYVPSLVVANAAHGVDISIRGVTTTDITSKGEQDVAFNLDGVPIGRPEVMGLAFFDLDSVEVLRGPQGTLYGKSSTGGVVNLITAKPTDHFQAAASAEYGNYNTRRGEGMVNIPVTDSFAIRAAASANYRDGFIHPVLDNPYTVNTGRPLDDENNWTGRVTGRYLLPDGLGDATLTGTFGHIGGTGDTGEVLYSSWLHDSHQSNPKVYYNPLAGDVDDNFQNYNGALNLNLGPVKFSYDGGFQRFSADDNYDPSTGDPAANGDVYAWREYHALITTDSQEIRFTNATSQRFDWLVGGNYIREDIDEHDLNWNTLSSCAPSLAPDCNAPSPAIVGPTKHSTEGAFGQVNFHLTDKLTLTGGLRFSADTTSRDATIIGGVAPGVATTADGSPCGPPDACVGPNPLNDQGSVSSTKLTWLAGVRYQLTLVQMIYATVSTGYKPGGFNDLNPLAPASGVAPYAPETLTAYEAGYKARVLDNLQYNTSIYYYDFSRYQLTGGTFFTPNFTGGAPNVLIYTTNPPATLYGWENEVKYNPTPDDTFSATLALEKGYFDSGKDHATVGFIFSNQIDFSNKTLDNLPTTSATLAYEHRFYLASGGYVAFRANSKISSSYRETDYAGNGNPFAGVYSLLPNQYKQPAFTRSDLDLSYTTASGKYTLDAYVKDIENDTQLLGPPTNFSEGPTGATVRISSPRFFGVRLSGKF